MLTYYLYTYRYLAASIVVYLIYKYLSKYFAKIEERIKRRELKPLTENI